MHHTFAVTTPFVCLVVIGLHPLPLFYCRLICFPLFLHFLIQFLLITWILLRFWVCCYFCFAVYMVGFCLIPHHHHFCVYAGTGLPVYCTYYCVYSLRLCGSFLHIPFTDLPTPAAFSDSSPRRHRLAPLRLRVHAVAHCYRVAHLYVLHANAYRV